MANSNSSSFDARTELQTLPQFQFIKESHIQPWIDQVMRIDPDRLPWHVRRLSGIGGSEIGVLLGAFRGEFHPHTDANRLIGQKLLSVLPEEPNGHLLRGQIMEDTAKDLYRKQILKKYPNAKPREDIIKKLATFRDDERPWVIGTPDEVMELEPGKIWIIDYKCPTHDALSAYAPGEVPYYYSAQLHHYRYIAEKMGYKIAGLQLASLDYNNFTMDLRNVAYDPLLEKDCLHVGDYYWNEFVMKGIVPPKVHTKTYGDANDIHEEILERAIMYTLYQTIGNAFAKKGKRLSERTKEEGLSLNSNIDSINVGVVDVKADREFNLEAMAQHLQETHHIPSSLFREEDSWDLDKLLQFVSQTLGVNTAHDPKLQTFKVEGALSDKLLIAKFRELGEDLEQFITKDEIKFALSRAQNNYSTTMKEGLQNFVETASEQFVNSLRDKMIALEDKYHEAQIIKAVNKKNKPK